MLTLFLTPAFSMNITHYAHCLSHMYGLMCVCVSVFF
jgi:hypothetical protein